MLRTLYTTVSWVFSVFSLLLLVYVILIFVRPRPNWFTETLNRVMDTVLNPIRRFLRARLPVQMQILDWSPLVLYLLMRLVMLVLRLVTFGSIWSW